MDIELNHKTNNLSNTKEEIEKIVREELFKNNIKDEEFQKKLTGEMKQDINIKIESYKKKNLNEIKRYENSEIDWSKLKWTHQNI